MFFSEDTRITTLNIYMRRWYFCIDIFYFNLGIFKWYMT